MKLREVFRFELVYQMRRPWPWLAFAVLLVFSMEFTRVGILPVTLPEDFVLNSPFIIATVSVFSCLIWLLVASAMAGEAAARDVQTGMYPLTFSAPVKKREYLGGRFLAALLLNVLVLLGVQVGSLLAVYAGGVEPEIIGPFRPAAYLAALAFIALPNAFTATTIQFAVALLTGRPLASYAGSVGLFFFAVPIPMLLYVGLGQQELALLMDPIGMFAIMNEMMTEWTIVEKNVRMFTLDGPMQANRLLWSGISVLTLAFIYMRFSFTHRTGAGIWERVTRRLRRAEAPDKTLPATPISVPQTALSFGVAVHARQAFSTAWSSFRMIVSSVPGLFLLIVLPMFIVLVLSAQSAHWGIAIEPRTGYILSKHLTAPFTYYSDFRIVIPLLIVYFAGQLVWRERDAQLGESIDATAVPEWVLLVGKFLGLGLVLAALMVGMAAAGMVAQSLMDYHNFEVGVYLKILFGLQLPEYLLFAVVAFLVHVIVNQKHVAMLVTLVALVCVASAGSLGIQHNLLIYGGGPVWYFTDIRGFGSSLGPWAWFKLYWAAWALLLGLVARLLWVRGLEGRLAQRLRTAHRRFSRAAAGVAALGIGLVSMLGGFIFYNTNVLNEYIPEDEVVLRQVKYEQRYGNFEGIPQPRRTATKLQVEIYPERRKATVTGTYTLVNRDAVPIDSVHLEPAFSVETSVAFDRAARTVVADEELGHHIYALEEPLQPGDSLILSFDVLLERRGFTNSGSLSSGAGQSILENGTYFTAGMLPVIGYQRARELMGAHERRVHGLPRQLTLPPPGDIDPNLMTGGASTFEAIVGTAEDEVAVAPGELRGTWSENGRRYFHYASTVPIKGEEVFFSADYKVYRERRNGVDLQVYLHPGHAEHLERVLRSVRASLDYYSEAFGGYPQNFLQIVEQPGNFLGMGVDGSGVVTGGEGFFLLDPQGDGFDGIFEIVAHEMGHQWWGMQVTPAFAEGGGIISESLAWYSAMTLVKHVKGREALRRFMSIMRQPNPWPPIRTGLPLLRAMDPWANYRKGPYAMHALTEYVGEERIHKALRRFLEKNDSSAATTLDMYRELQAVTPDTLKPLLHDLFEVDAVWTFDTEEATAQPTADGRWHVRFVVEALKIVADSAGVETEVPMTEPVEIGVFAPAKEGEILGKPLYVKKHPVRLGTQTISVTVSEKPDRGGIDPYNLLDWQEEDNIEKIEIIEVPKQEE